MRLTVGALLCLMLAACSGGGGSSNSAPTVSISISPTSLSSNFTAGQSVPISVTATTSAAVNQTVFVTIIDSVGVVMPNVTISPNSATSYSVTLFTSAALAAGTHTGSLRVNVCYDSGCSRHLGNSPLTIPYTFQVAARNTFAPSPATLTHTQPTGTASQVSLTVNPSQTVSGPFFVRVGSSPAVLSAGTSFTEIGNGSFTVTVTLNPALNPGRSTGVLAFSVCRDTGCAQHVSGSPFEVPYDITILPLAASAFTLNPSVLTGSHVVGTTVASNLSLMGPSLQRPVYARLTDAQGVLGPTVSLTPNADPTKFGLHVQVSPTKPVGHYNGSGGLMLCANQDCSIELAAGTISLPYDIQVIPPVSFSPATLSGRFSTGFPFAARTIVTKNTAAMIYLGAVSEPNTFQEPDITALYDGTYSFVAYAVQSLAPQHKTGSVAVRVCSDMACTNEVPGSPVLLPYDFTVEPLRTLARYPGVEDWETYQGNSSHTGYVPITVDPANIVPRWTWATPNPDVGFGDISALAIDDGRVFVSAEKHLHALAEHDGAQVWSRDFSGLPSSPGGIPGAVQLNPPAAAGGRVFAATSGHAGTFMWALSANDGTQLFQTPFSAQWEHYLAPTLYDGTVYSNGGYYGGMYGFDIATGAEQFFSTQLPQYDEWTPAVDANYAYTYVGGDLYILDRHTGTRITAIHDDSYRWSGWSMDTSPVIGTAGSVTAVNVLDSLNNALVNFDTTGESVRWSVPGGYTGTPAYRSGVLYAVNRLPVQLEARDEANGALLWSWTPPRTSENTFIGDVLVTDNVVFLSTNEAVYGVSLTTHNTVWSWPKSGRLALSANGVLYISTYGPTQNANVGDIVAFDLNR